MTDNSGATLLRLFMRIDANCDGGARAALPLYAFCNILFFHCLFVTFWPGTVSWDEFISFMLCQDQGASIIAEESGRAQFQLPVQIEPAMRCTGHEESVVRVMVSAAISFQLHPYPVK